MVTYSDTVTLLMTFFVLMLTFSTMEDEDLNKLSGVLNGSGTPGFFTSADRKQQPGSARFRAIAPKGFSGPRRTPAEDAAARDRNVQPSAVVVEDHAEGRIIAFRTGDLFDGEQLSPAGRRVLSTVAAFLKPLKVHVAVRVASHLASPGVTRLVDADTLSSGRAARVAERLAAAGLARARISVSTFRHVADRERIELLVVQGEI
jgi:chemotaxis protein MotB